MQSVDPLLEGAVEGPYGRSEALRGLSDPSALFASAARGARHARNGVDFATSGPEAQSEDVRGGVQDRIARMRPLEAAGTGLRTGVDLASGGGQELAEDVQRGVQDTGTRTASTLATGLAASAALRMVPVIGPAAAITNTVLTGVGALQGLDQGHGGGVLSDVEKRVEQRRIDDAKK